MAVFLAVFLVILAVFLAIFLAILAVFLAIIARHLFQVIIKPAIWRVVRMGGVKRIFGLIYEIRGGRSSSRTSSATPSLTPSTSRGRPSPPWTWSTP